jgi:hypothetical protein
MVLTREQLIEIIYYIDKDKVSIIRAASRLDTTPYYIKKAIKSYPDLELKLKKACNKLCELNKGRQKALMSNYYKKG